MIARVVDAFQRHPATVGESYFEHMAFAARFGTLMFAAGAAALIHALLPFAFETTASSIVRKMCAEMDARARNHR
ncbi:MAG: hypothetical protein KDJ55_15150 [Rhodobiaceae bacterium]|nr:hypothetical protein [Rhodobiaceae bacterium]MCC0012506.1 hypothetical protein [Rhodobiaceae bacterium]MCC0061713.1 hypothetical protein [Rhodobiaceae bacterium]